MPKYVRVKDPSTKHEFDVPETDPRIKANRLVRIKDDRYPPVAGPRRPKHHIENKTTAVAEKEPKNG